MKKKFKSRIFSLIMAMAIAVGCIGGAIPAMAAETDSGTEGITEVLSIPVADVEAAVASGEYDSEAEAIRALFSEQIAAHDKVRANYLTAYWGYATFKGTEYGENFHTCYGQTARLAIAFRPSSGNRNQSFKVDINTKNLQGNMGTFKYTMTYNPNSLDSDYYYMFVGSWYTGTGNNAYKVLYQPTGYAESMTVDYHVWCDYK